MMCTGGAAISMIVQNYSQPVGAYEHVSRLLAENCAAGSLAFIFSAVRTFLLYEVGMLRWRSVVPIVCTCLPCPRPSKNSQPDPSTPTIPNGSFPARPPLPPRPISHPVSVQLEAMRRLPDAQTQYPFIFDGHPGFGPFRDTLARLVMPSLAGGGSSSTGS